jgi:hypothetical protein
MNTYGISLSVYFPVLIILELIVILGFVLPIYELLTYGYIGVTSLTIWPGAVSIPSWVIEASFFGAFVHSFLNMMDRVPRKDVRPGFYLNTLVRYILSVALASVIYIALGGTIPTIVLVGLVFVIGMLPNVFLRYLEDSITSRLKLSLSADMPLSHLPGISRMESSRLWEEGINNTSQLADSNVAELHKRTHYSYCRLSTIIGSALLWRAIGGDKNAPSETPSANKDPQKSKPEPVCRMEVLRANSINTIQDLSCFVFDINQEDIWASNADKSPIADRVDMLAQKLGMEKQLVLNAAASIKRYQNQIMIPPSAVERVVSMA